MLFNLPADTECELTSFVGRTQKNGNDDGAERGRLRDEPEAPLQGAGYRHGRQFCDAGSWGLTSW